MHAGGHRFDPDWLHHLDPELGPVAVEKAVRGLSDGNPKCHRMRSSQSAVAEGRAVLWDEWRVCRTGGLQDHFFNALFENMGKKSRGV